ncbi:MAG: 16S rRNA (cytosine(1402)-N(4))-methyltransferase RsmH [Clostridiaceae bacterium]|jgi:16S rRNA (cytosine1402-N4)-methyltransferase|nr:16S rRNA (cytosine(1402)-N(4))-methyltransferase RsmH [Clostridiaceae bacterium]
MEFEHKPIMLEECIEFLDIRPDGIYVDGTLGGGGHSAEILRRLGPKGLLIGLDQDKNAIKAAESRLLDINSKAEVVIEHTNFENIREVLKAQKIDSVDGILLDLGVSSHQLDEGERGFSYQHDAPLDMRMNQSDSFNAQILLNSWSKDEIARVIRDYGEEKWAARIADFIVRNREAQKITTTGQLVDIIKAAVPAAARREGPHPAKRTFQALRIAVNRELEVLENLLGTVNGILKPKGRVVIITFHSLEDRIVKKAFQEQAQGCICPRDFPKCVCGIKPELRIITRKPVTPSDSELNENPRARSAKLRAAEKL